MWRPHAFSAALFAALAAVMTWPLAAHLDSAMTWPGDPLINTWILDWDWWATFHCPLSLFQANIFYPAKLSLAYSENLYGIAVVLFPFRALGVPPLAAYNLAMLLGYAFSGFGAYLLGWTVTRGWWAGVAAGIFYAFVPFRIMHASHVQHVWAGWLPILIAALLHYKAQPTWRNAALFGGAFLMNGLSNIHWLLFGSVAIFITALGVIPSAARNPLRRSAGDSSPSMRLGMTRAVVPIAACTLAAGLLLAPFLIPYAKVAREYNMRRTWQETKGFSAAPRDWFVAGETMRWYGALKDPKVDAERWLFPGALGLVFSMLGLAWWRPSPGASGATLSPLAGRGAGVALLVAIAWIAIGVAGSLGTHLFFHRFLFAHVPGFQAIRVPARWANIAYAGMAMLIASGVKRFAPIAAAALAVELCAAPLLWFLALPAPPPVYAAAQKAHAILELPIGTPLDYASMFYATAHHRPLVNGSSGFTPPETQRIESLVNTDALLPELNRIGVDTIVIHGDGADAPMRAWLARELERGRLRYVGRYDARLAGDWLFSTTAPPRRSPELEAFLAGRPTFNSGTFGLVQLPYPNQTIEKNLYVSGFAFSPYGVRSVTLLLQDGRVRVPAFLFEDASLTKAFPWYDATVRPRFMRVIEHRPDGVARRTDLQVEVVDGRGERVLLEDRFFIWPDRR